MRLQMIELEEVTMIETSDESLEAVVGGLNYILASNSCGAIWTSADCYSGC